jgi:hypothetical protein
MAVFRMTVTEAITRVNDASARLNGGSIELHPTSVVADGDTLVSSAAALVIFPLPDPAFGSAVDATDIARATANPIGTALGIAAGDALSAVFRDFGGTQRFVTDVTEEAGDGFVKVSSLSISIGQEISITLGRLTLSQNVG